MATINSGIPLRIVARAVYNFGGLAANQAMTIVLARHIDVTSVTEVDLGVRIHAANIAAGGAPPPIMQVQIVPDGYDFEDPAQDFFGTSAGSFTINSSTTVPGYSMTAVTSGFGRLVAVQLVGTMGSNATANLSATLSIDLVLKGGDPTALGMMPNAFRGYRIM